VTSAIFHSRDQSASTIPRPSVALRMRATRKRMSWLRCVWLWVSEDPESAVPAHEQYDTWGERLTATVNCDGGLGRWTGTVNCDGQLRWSTAMVNCDGQLRWSTAMVNCDGQLRQCAATVLVGRLRVDVRDAWLLESRGRDDSLGLHQPVPRRTVCFVQYSSLPPGFCWRSLRVGARALMPRLDSICATAQAS
jgi:hypothetical protein